MLWIFVTLNYLYCDIMALMDPEMLRQFLTGTVEGMIIDQNFLMAAAILMEIPMGMVILARVLPVKYNRPANIISGTIMTLVQLTTLFIGSFTSYYFFFSVIEISTTAFIIGYALRWRE